MTENLISKMEEVVEWSFELGYIHDNPCGNCKFFELVGSSTAAKKCHKNEKPDVASRFHSCSKHESIPFHPTGLYPNLRNR